MFAGTLVLLTGSSWLTTTIGQRYFPGAMIGSTDVKLTRLFLIQVLIIAPIVEEILFRGFLLPLFERKFSWRISNGITSFLFAILHGHAYWLPFFVTGWLYGWSKKESQTLIMPITLHFAYNVIALGTQIYG